jgi:hypothetical protein
VVVLITMIPIPISLRYDIDRQVMEAHHLSGRSRTQLERVGFLFSWEGGAHWELANCVDYSTTLANLTTLGYRPKILLESDLGWNLIEVVDGDGDGEWEWVKQVSEGGW